MDNVSKQGHFTNSSLFAKIHVADVNYMYNDLFCTRHESWVIMACRKLWPDRIIKINNQHSSKKFHNATSISSLHQKDVTTSFWCKYEVTIKWQFAENHFQSVFIQSVHLSDQYSQRVKHQSSVLVQQKLGRTDRLSLFVYMVNHEKNQRRSDKTVILNALIAIYKA